MFGERENEQLHSFRIQSLPNVLKSYTQPQSKLCKLSCDGQSTSICHLKNHLFLDVETFGQEHIFTNILKDMLLKTNVGRYE